MRFHTFSAVHRKSTSYIPHSHTEYEFHYICRGRCHFYRGGEKVFADNGSFLYFSPGEEHFIYFDDGDGPVSHYKFLASGGEDGVIELLERGIPGKMFHAGSRRILFFEEVRRKFESGNALLAEAGKHSLLAFLFEYAAAGTGVERSGVHDKVEALILLMQGSVFGEIDLKGFLEECGFSESYFIRSFKEVTGLPPNQYYIRLKIDTARELLLETDDPVKLIARELSFTDEFYFSKTFKKWTGMSPLRYREELGGVP